MNHKNLASIIAIGICSCTALAESYQYEVGLDYLYVTLGDMGSRDTFGVNGSYYFSPVNTVNLPLAEAAFINRASNIHINALDDPQTVSLRGEWYLSAIPLYLGAQTVHQDTPLGSDNHWMASIGLTPIDGLRLYTNINDESYTENLHIKYLLNLGTGTHLNLEADYEARDNTSDYIALFADYYFTHRISLGLGYEDLGTDAFSLRGRLFFTEALSAEARGRHSDYGSRVEAGVRYRF